MVAVENMSTNCCRRVMLRNVAATIADNALTPIANAAFNIHMYSLYVLSIVKYFVDKAASHHNPLLILKFMAMGHYMYLIEKNLKKWALKYRNSEA